MSSSSKILGLSGREDTETMREVEIPKEKDCTAEGWLHLRRPFLLWAGQRNERERIASETGESEHDYKDYGRSHL